MPQAQQWTTDPGRIRDALTLRLAADAQAWLDEGLASAARESDVPRQHSETDALPTWERHFAEAGRHCRGASGPDGRAPAQTGAPAQPSDDLVDAARVLLLHAARADLRTVERLYRQGSRAERRAVLSSLPYLGLGEGALPLVEDALRSNDTSLTAAALGPYAARYLDAHSWRQALLKCLFTDVPVTAVAGLEHRARGDGELVRMLTSYADERKAAGRPVPCDLPRVLALATSAPDLQES
ncbi:EboA domain-containing protein [Streptomyces sp. NPDC047108]|uniref:EboA domain-containing protein n=1 Tax=Streptomyces sp. NPDC047108 TaxID=3155025 RepID=UPI0033DBC12A